MLLETVLVELELLEGAVDEEHSERTSIVVASARCSPLTLAACEKASSCEREVTEIA